MDISGLNSMYSQYTDAVKSSVDTEALKGRINNAENATDEELMKVCKEFEAYFVEQVYKEMINTIPQEKNSTSSLVDYFKDQTVSEIAKQTTEGANSIGLAQSLYEQMRRNYE